MDEVEFHGEPPTPLPTMVGPALAKVNFLAT